MSGRVNWLLTENQTENQGFQSKTQCQVGADGKPDGKLASIGSCEWNAEFGSNGIESC